MSGFSFGGLIGPEFLQPPADDEQGAGDDDALAEVRGLLHQAVSAAPTPDLNEAQCLRHWALSAVTVSATEAMTATDLLAMARWLIEGDERP